KQVYLRRAAKIRAVGIKHDTAGDGVLFRRIANDKAISDECEDRRCNLQMRDRFLSRLELALFKQSDFHGYSRCAVMEINRASIFERARRRFFDAKAGRSFNLRS